MLKFGATVLFVVASAIFFGCVLIASVPSAAPPGQIIAQIDADQAKRIAWDFVKRNNIGFETLEFEDISGMEEFYLKSPQFLNAEIDDNWQWGRGTRWVVSFSRHKDGMLLSVLYELSLNGKYILSEHVSRREYSK